MRFYFQLLLWYVNELVYTRKSLPLRHYVFLVLVMALEWYLLVGGVSSIFRVVK